MKKKVCHVTSVHKWNDIRIYRKECISLVNFGYDVNLLVLNSSFKGESNGVNVHSVQLNYSSTFSRIFKASAILHKKAVEIDADVYHIHDPELLPLGKRLTKAGKRVIFDAHEDTGSDILKKELIPRPFRKIASLIYNSYEKSLVKSFFGVISVTEKLTARFGHKHAETIKNYPILDSFQPEVPYHRRDNIIVYVGGLMKIRGISECIKAMKHLNDYTLVLAGPFDSEIYQKECESLEEWDKKVEYLGTIELEKVYRLLERAKLGLTMLYPTKGHLNSLPIKTFEYLAAGTPVLMTEIPYWREVFKEQGNYTSSFESKDLAKAMLRAIEESNEEQNQKNREVVLEKFNWVGEAQKLDNFYR